MSAKKTLPIDLPTSITGDGLSPAQFKQAIEYINERLYKNLTLTAIATELGLSPAYFCRLFKRSIGITPHQYILQQRIERSKQLLSQKDIRIVDIANHCGFANPSHFARCFRKMTGISPQQFREMGSEL
jgi:AraC family transcriptional regulator